MRRGACVVSTESWTNYEVDEKRVVSGQVWRCKNPMFCHTYPGHPSSNSWFLVGDCHDPNAGGSPACQCSEGACCDGCYFRPQSHFCGEVARDTMCLGDDVPACTGAKDGIRLDYWNLFCNGDSNQCTRWGAHTSTCFKTVPGRRSASTPAEVSFQPRARRARRRLALRRSVAYCHREVDGRLTAERKPISERHVDNPRRS